LIIALNGEFMTTTVNQQEQIKPVSKLPVRNNLKAGYLVSALIVLCTAIATIAGIFYTDQIYPTTEARQAFIANDVVTLFIGLPILLISMWLTYRGKLIGLLFWPGAIFYGLYNYTTSLFGAPLTIMYPLYLIIVTLSIYTTIGLIATIQSEPVKQKLTGHVSEKLSSGPLIGLGVAFGMRALVILVTATIDQTSLPGPELGLLVADFIACAAWVIGGIMLWRRQALGYVTGPGLLFSISMLFIGVIAILLLQPIISGAPLLVMDILVLSIMGLICFVPFVLYVRGVIKS
jgi:hypothetical protein